MAQHTQLAPLVIGRGRVPAGQQASQTEAGGGEQEEMEDQLAPDALAVWSDACRAAGLPASSARCGLVAVCDALMNRAGGGKEDLGRAAVVLWDLTSGSGEVTREHYAIFLKYFGSITRCLEKLRDVMTSGVDWFHGNRAREESEALLAAGGHEKQFLLRYSSNVGAFTVDYIKGGKICHFNNIRNDPDAGIEVMVGRPPAQHTYKYSNLNTFVTKNQHIFGEPCVNHESAFHRLQLRLASDDGFSSLADLLPLQLSRPATSTHQQPKSENDTFRAIISPKGKTPRDLAVPRSHSDQERTQRQREKSDKQAKKEHKKAKHKKDKKEKGAEVSKSWSSDAADVSLRIKQSLNLAGKTSRPSLDLRSMHIGPDLPSAVCELRNLVSLDLSHNNLTELPDALGTLEKLETLDVTDNKLTHLNPAIFSGGMRRLTSFICADNLLTTIPDTLFEGVGRYALAHLDFSCNQLTSVPKSVSKLKYKLQFLDLSLNSIEKLPQAITKLTYLEEFYIKGNKLRQLPRRMSSMISLMVLDVADNQLHEVPDELFLHTKAMPGFVLITSGNALDTKVVDARMVMVQKAKPQNQSVQDLFDVYNFGLKYDRGGEGSQTAAAALSSSGRVPALLLASPKGAQPDLKSPNSKGDGPKPECVLARLAAESVHISYLPSLWRATPGYRLEHAIDTDAPLEPDRQRDDADVDAGDESCHSILYEHSTIFDYRRFFHLRTVHTNIIGNEKRLGPVCVSIQKELKDMEPEDPSNEAHCKTPGTYRVLIRTVQGDRVAELPTALVKQRKKERYARSNDLLQAVKKHLDASHKLKFSIDQLYVIRDAASHEAFAELEDKLKVNSFKFGVLYAKENQDEIAMYNNQEASEGFDNFVSVLGDRIQLEGWTKYSAGLNTNRSGQSVYTVFQGLEVMFHVSTLLPFRQRTDELGQQWERKQHIGNDVVVIVYYEGTSQLDPAIFESQFNHVFAIVQPIPGSDPVSYRLHMAYKDGVSTLTDVRPPLPARATLKHGLGLRDYLLTKLINAERCAMSAERFQKPTQRLRQILFSELQTRFPKATKQEAQKQLFSLPRGKRKSRDGRVAAAAAGEYHSLSPGRDDAAQGYMAPDASGDYSPPMASSPSASSSSSEYMTPDVAARVARELDKAQRQ